MRDDCGSCRCGTTHGVPGYASAAAYGSRGSMRPGSALDTSASSSALTPAMVIWVIHRHPACMWLKDTMKRSRNVSECVGGRSWCQGQGDRILSGSGEHRQQVVFVETTEAPFLSQTDGVRWFSSHQIEGNESQRRHLL